jgi:hypothetical protein
VKLVIAPEPATWLRPLLDTLAGEEVLVVAPWAVPSRLAALFPRHALGSVRHVSLPGGFAVRALARRAAVALGDGADLALTLHTRVALDALVAAWLPTGVTQIFAPSLAAQRTFSKSRAEGVLLQDLPLLRALHAGLDAAAEQLPAATFLQNYRAPRGLMVRQEAEHVLARRVLVTSRFARTTLRRRGVASERVGALPMPSRAVPLAYDEHSRHVLLALEAISRTDDLLLSARRGAGSQHALLSHPRLRLYEGAPPPVRAVVAPAWVEAFAPETERAAASGVPLLGTECALGWLEGASTMAPGDTRRLFDFIVGASAKRSA